MDYNILSYPDVIDLVSDSESETEDGGKDEISPRKHALETSNKFFTLLKKIQFDEEVRFILTL